MKYILVSNNQNKCREIGTILGLEVVPYTDITGQVLDIEETGKTYEENALIKVKAIGDIDDAIVFADDSGIEVAALDGRPGLYSARYGSDQMDADEKCDALLAELGPDTTNRAARFCCAIAYRHGPSKKTGCVHGIVQGTLTTQRRGTFGFGYDPIFIPNGYSLTLGEMRPEKKQSLSHRYLALMAFEEEIKSIH